MVKSTTPGIVLTVRLLVQRKNIFSITLFNTYNIIICYTCIEVSLGSKYQTIF